jgi:hypothetical protein
VTPELILPSSVKPRYRCTIPGCDATFHDRKSYVRHCVACAKRHEDDIGQFLKDRDENVFTGINDTEQYDWLRKRATERGEK